jgi:hypothetical protein
MSTEYRIEPVGSQFIVVDPWGEIVALHQCRGSSTEHRTAARRNMQLRKRHIY